MSLYYDADGITLYLGDCTVHTEWLAADVLVTDPPYGMGYRSRYSGDEVTGDRDTQIRDRALALWGRKPAMVFGSWRNIRPTCDQVLIWDKGDEAALGHPTFFSAHEEIYVIGQGWVGPRRSNVIRLNGLARGGGASEDARSPHAQARLAHGDAASALPSRGGGRPLRRFRRDAPGRARSRAQGHGCGDRRAALRVHRGPVGAGRPVRRDGMTPAP